MPLSALEKLVITHRSFADFVGQVGGGDVEPLCCLCRALDRQDWSVKWREPPTCRLEKPQAVGRLLCSPMLCGQMLPLAQYQGAHQAKSQPTRPTSRYG
jgi:hypothetical protein